MLAHYKKSTGSVSAAEDKKSFFCRSCDLKESWLFMKASLLDVAPQHFKVISLLWPRITALLDLQLNVSASVWHNNC